MEVVKPSKKIINYLDQLTGLSDVEQIYKLIYKELATFKKIRNISLCFSTAMNNNVIYYKEKNRVCVKQLETLWSADTNMRLDNIEDSKFLANCLKRPVGQLLSFPLVVNQLNLESKTLNPAVIYIEHMASKLEQDALIKDLILYIQPVQFALERAFLQAYMHSASIEWQNTFDGLKDPICVIDKNYNSLRSNKSFSDSLEKESCHKIFAKRDEPCRGCPVADVLLTGKYQTSVIKKESETYEVHSYPIKRNNDESITTIVSHYINITKKQDLLGKMLQSEKLAVIGHLAGNIAHELNNPLTGIKSLTEVLSAEVDKGSQIKDDLNEVHKAAIRCQNIIKSLMLFSSENPTANKKVLSVNEQVNISLTLLKSALRSLNVHINLTSDEAKIFVVPELFIQVLFNLIQNACQATPESGNIEISTLVDAGSVVFKVKDSGCGIAKEIMSEIFTPFFTTKKENQGTGLGLSMSLGVIESFGGKIIVNSAVGVGSEFIVRLPKHEGAES